MRTYIFLILLSTSIYSFAQTGSLKGHVSFLDDNSDLSNLTILLVQNGKEIAGAITDNEGNYVINNIPEGIYDLKFTMLGFRDKIIKDFVINEGLIIENFVFPDPCKPSEKICPQGHSDSIIPIIYGYPTKKQLKKAKKGKIKLGGCVITNCDPKWHCTKHNIDF
ncbi:MAG: carboxypeptidase regulatory-like domain-containing protein [Candidatus Methanofastidiosa archaeon]|nr:carboxypeptidase regulatory-like domain-containing protein [Candidatus Methanofastidiosa archaeon]